MRLWPRHLATRLACAFVLAVVAVVVLALVVEHVEKVPKPTKRASGPGPSAVGLANPGAPSRRSVGQPDPLRAGGPVLANAVMKRRATAQEQSLNARARLGSSWAARRLRPTNGTILLAHRESALAPDIAPVVEILTTGELVVRRPEPLALAPLQRPALSGGGHGAGVVLPAQDIEKLSPLARGALIALLQQWLVERPITPAKLQSSDVLMYRAAVRRLLSWVP